MLASATLVVLAQQGQKPPQVPSISQRPSGASLGTIRIGAADSSIWFGWRVAMPANAIKGMTLSDVLAHSDAPLGLLGVDALSTQQVSFEVPKPLDQRLKAGERGALNYRLRELNQQILVYRLESVPADDASRRGLFELAKQFNAPGPAPLLVMPADVANLISMNARTKRALTSRSRARQSEKGDGRARRTRRTHGDRRGPRRWMHEGIKPTRRTGDREGEAPARARPPTAVRLGRRAVP